MKLRNLLFLYTRRVLTHPLQELLALIGIAVGVALVFAVQVANTSVAGSVEQLVHGVTGSATLQVAARDPHGIDASLATRIARLPGVRAAAPTVEIRMTARGPRGSRTVTLIGGDRRLVALHGKLLSQFALGLQLNLTSAVSLPQPVAQAIGLDAGDTLRLASGTHTFPATVASVLTPDQIGSLVDSPIALTSLVYAEAVGNLGPRVTRVLVATAPGQKAAVEGELRRLVGDHANVGPSDLEAVLARQASKPNDQSTAMFAVISAIVGLLFAFNAMLLTAPERRRFIADLRIEGLGDGTVFKLVLFDALVLGLASSVLGLVLGDQLSRHVFHATPGYLSFAFVIGDQRIVELSSVLLAVAGGVIATLLAAVWPLEDVVMRRPLDSVDHGEDDETTRPPGRWTLAGGIALIAAAAALLLAPQAIIVGIGLLVAGMLLLLPHVISATLVVLEAISHRVRSAVLLVSIGELRTSRTRAIALAATGALAVFGTVAVEGAHFDLQRGLDHDAHLLNAQAALWITPGGNENALSTTLFVPPPTRRIAAVRGVASVRAYRGTFLDVGDRRVWILGPPRADTSPIFRSQVVSGNYATAVRRLRQHGWVAVSQAIARDQHLAVGDRVTLPTPVQTPLRVAAVLTNLGWTSGAVVLNADDFQRAWGNSDVAALQVALAPGASPTATAQRLRATLQPGSDLVVESAGARELRFRTLSRQGLNRLTQIATLLLVAAALALAAALGGVVWSRRPRLATLKLSGFTEGEVWRALLLESTFVLGIGCAVGAALGLFGQFMLTRWLQESTGFPTSYSPAGFLALATFAGVTLVAIAIAALPGWMAARVPLITSFQSD